MSLTLKAREVRCSVSVRWNRELGVDREVVVFDDESERPEFAL